MKEIEKELLRKIEKKYESSSQVKVVELKYENESLVDSDSSNTYKEHFVSSSVKKETSFTSKITLYNEKVGNYQFNFNSSLVANPKQFTKSSQISKYLLDKGETLSNILGDFNNELNQPESFNFRMFKYLDSYSDVCLNHSDLQLRQKVMTSYVVHIINHMMKRKEEIEYGDRIEKLIIRSSDKTMITQLKDDLFVNEDADFLKSYEGELKNFAPGKEDLFEEFRVKGKYQTAYSDADYDLIKDQGFTAPRVLILVPNKKHARLLVEEILAIMRGGNWKGVSNKKKFKEEFSEAESMNDCFRLGINFDFFKNKLRLYQPFDASDIIIASPLGLKMTTANDESVKNKKVYDFLSSIEVLLVDFAEVFLYQNIEHLEEILSFLNKTPKNNQNIVNINRIGAHVLEDALQYKRQSIVISHFKSLELEMIVRKYCKNLIGGRYVLNEQYEGVLQSGKDDNVVKYEFKMLKTFDDMELYDYKFNYFTKNLWQSLYDTFERHTVIFASSALDFLRLRNFFKKNSVSVTYISEDTDKKDWQRNRLFFEEGRYKFLLYSERAHFYKKINLKFAKNIFFYSLPEDPTVFKEMIDLITPEHYKASLEKYNIEDKNMLSGNYSAVIALVTKMEKYSLEKIVGSSTCSNIIKSKLDKYVC